MVTKKQYFKELNQSLCKRCYDILVFLRCKRCTDILCKRCIDIYQLLVNDYPPAADYLLLTKEGILSLRAVRFRADFLQ